MLMSADSPRSQMVRRRMLRRRIPLEDPVKMGEVCGRARYAGTEAEMAWGKMELITAGCCKDLEVMAITTKSREAARG